MKMLNKTRYLIWSLLLLLGWGCQEIVSPDISNLQLTINSPADSLYTAEQTISFWWEADADVEQYQFRITEGVNGNVFLVLDTLMANNQLGLTFAGEGIFDWQLRGVNSGTESAWQSRSFILDRTAPDKATALNMDGDVLIGPASDSLVWASTDLAVSSRTFPTRDSLLIYRRNDSTTVGAKYFFGEEDTRSLTITSSSPAPMNGVGFYYWQVITFDRAGNRKASDLFRFEVQ